MARDDTYVVVFLHKFHDVGRVVSQLADGAALYQLTQFTIDRLLVLRHCKDNRDLRLGNLVRQLAYRRIVLRTDDTHTFNYYYYYYYYYYY